MSHVFDIIQDMGRFRFIIGSAGCGKSSYIYETLTARTLEEQGRQFYLFVPEQNTLKAQQELIRHSAVHGMLSLDVLSFTQLSYRVMEELDIPAPDVLDEISKSVLMRKALSKVKDQLTVYKNKTGSQGFVAQLKSAVSEFSQYGITEEELHTAAGSASTPLLGGKLRDLETVLRAFRELIHGGTENHVIPEEVPELLLKNLERSHLLEGAVLYFDGFTGFTPLQLAILERMAGQAAELNFAVTIPATELHSAREHYTDLFWLSRETVKKVTDACTRAGILKDDDILLNGRNAGEKKISDRLTVPADLEVTVAGFDDPTEEVRYVAAKIRERAVLENGRYRRMAVAVSELGTYREIIRREFTACGLPFFIDDRTAGAGSPVVELLRSALLTVTGNYAYEDVMTFLKNPLVSGEDRRMPDIIDNFVRATGLRGRKAWQEDWRLRKYIPACAGEDLNGPEEWKQEHLKDVFRLQDELKEEKTCGGKAVAMLAFLERLLGSDPKEGTGEAGEETAALTGDDVRFAQLSGELFERLGSLFSTEEISVREFADLVEAGFGDMKAGMIPHVLDSLSVGDLKRSRFDDIDDLYLIGANEGKIPQNVSGGGIFTDRERMELAGKNLELAPDDRHDAVIQNYYLYLYLHKPVKSLTVSFAAAGRDGSRQKPSQILNNAAIVYPETEPVTYDGLLSEFTELLQTEKRKQSDAVKRKLLRDWKLLCAEEEMKPKAEAVLKAALVRHEPEKLDRETAGLLYGKQPSGSVTRLEKYEDCPYRHFLDYGLRLTERETFDVEAVDIGRMYHEALDGVIRELKEQGKTLGNVSREELGELASRKVRELTDSYNGNVMQESARNRYVSMQIRRITEKTLEKLQEQYLKGAFETKETEHAFRVKCGEMVLNGRIDRVDTLESEGKTYVKVIDYKSGSTEFDLGLCYEGLQMQLAAYMQAALTELEQKGKTAVPAGMFLYHIKDPVLGVTDAGSSAPWQMDGLCLDDVDVLRKMDRALEEDGASDVIPVKMKNGTPYYTSSVLGEEEFRLLLERNRERMNRDAAEILSGKIEALPVDCGKHNGCDYCPMKAVCGFDRRIPGYGYRRVNAPNKSTVTEKLKEELQ